MSQAQKPFVVNAVLLTRVYSKTHVVAAWNRSEIACRVGLRAAAEGAPLGKLSAVASGLLSALPDGNHGDNDFSTGCSS